MAIPFCIPTSNEGEFLLLHVLAKSWCCVLDFSHNKYLVVCSGFNLQFLNDMMLNIFHMLICHLLIFSDELSIFCLLFNCWVLRVLCKFWVTVHQICALQIFWVCGLFFHFLDSIFGRAKQRCLILTISILSVFSFIDGVFGVASKTHCQTQHHLDFLQHYKASKSFIVLYFTFRSRICRVILGKCEGQCLYIYGIWISISMPKI